jgi:hypothetical protein
MPKATTSLSPVTPCNSAEAEAVHVHFMPKLEPDKQYF